MSITTRPSAAFPCAARRPRRSVVTLLAAVTLILAACGDDDPAADATTASEEASGSASAPTDEAAAPAAEESTDTTSAPTETTTAAEAPADSFDPIEVDHFNGTTLIEAPAERAMSVSGQGDLEWMVALGVEPLAYGTRGEGEWPLTGYHEPLPTSVTYVDFIGGAVPIEAIAELQPDLLTGFGFLFDRDNNFELLSEIAPVVGYDTADDFRAVGTLMADALGLPEEGAALIAELEVELQAVRDALGDVSNVSLSLVSGGEDGSVRVLSPTFNAASFYYDDVGFAVTSVFDDLGLDTDNDQSISAELASAIAVDDVLVCLTFDEFTEDFCAGLPDDELIGLPDEAIVVTTTFSQVINVLAPGGLRASFDLITDEIAPQLADR
ncbi:MAG: ABC transporter substrate-binding protein [Actinomycetota bacterium]